jgi:hypothetical protein
MGVWQQTLRRPQHSRSSSKYWLSGYPQLVDEWHSDLNGDLGPRDVSYGSARRIWWRCRKGSDHIWQATPNARTAGKNGCPFCAGRQASVTNSLASLHPALAAEWNYERNGDLRPSDVVAGSTRRVWWKCTRRSEHEWTAAPRNRTETGKTCPFCRGVRASLSRSLAVDAPDVAAEWHATRNGSLLARDVTAGSSRKVWWQCRHDDEHVWQATIANRVRHRSGCPNCRRASRARAAST